MDKFGKKLILQCQSGNYEVMKGIDNPIYADDLPGIYNSETMHNSRSDLSLAQLCKNDTKYEATRVITATFTVSDAVDAIGFGKFQIILSVFTGVCWMAESMEMMTLSLLPPALECHFCISSGQQAALTTVVFVGMTISAPLWGNLSDRYGRRKTLWAGVGIIFVFGFASAFSVTFYWLLALRFLVGLALGSVFQSVTLYAEFLPSQQRAKCLILMSFAGTTGSCLEVLLAIQVMPTLGWQWLLGMSSLPILLYFLMCYWLPESVRYQAVSGQKEKALVTLQRIARANKQPMLCGQLLIDDANVADRGRFKNLIRPDLRLSSILLWFIWAACAFCYVGVVFLSTEILEQNKENREQIQSQDIEQRQSLMQSAEMFENVFMDGVCDTTRKSCKTLSTEDYADLLYVTLSEFPGILITIFMLDKLGRKPTMWIHFILFSLSIFAFVFKIEGRILTTSLLFVSRGLASNAMTASCVYTPEVYPTSMRAVALGTCSCMSRIGSMITPYVAQVLSKTSIPLAAATYGIVGLIAAVLSMLLPIETKGKALPD